QEQVEGVAEDHVVAERLHLGGVERLDRGGRGERDERGGADLPVRQTQDARASAARAGADLERAGGGHAGQRSPPPPAYCESLRLGALGRRTLDSGRPAATVLA